MASGEYLDFVAKEYLNGYVSRGGSAVKVLVVGGEAVARELTDGLATLGDGFANVVVDAANVKVHMIDHVFTAIAAQLDWDALAEAVVRRAYGRTDLPAAGTGPESLTVASVAAYHELDPGEVYRSVRRALESMILADTTLSHEFRVGMLRLCSALLDRGDVDPAERDTVLGWLRGEKLPAAALRRAGLVARVARHNARALLVSTTRWVRRAGRPGIVLAIDLERLLVARRPPAGLRDGVYYSKAAALDAYEVLRQIIDATDELEGLFVAVLLPPDLITDEGRGLPAYTALHLRVADEVRDRRRPNPYAALVRVGVRLEAVR
jgi:hypothetical protein